MAKNVEVKIRVEDLGPIRVRAQAVAGRGPFQLEQVDYFFPVANGRLKLRVETSDLPGQENKAELISYHRPDDATPRASDYVLVPTIDPDLLRQALHRSLGKGPVVRKNRELFLTERARIHLDTVEHLGQFVEIEVVMRDGEPLSDGHRELDSLVSRLQLPVAQIQSLAYADLLDDSGN